MEEMDSRIEYFDYDGHRKFGEYPEELCMNCLDNNASYFFFYSRFFLCV